MAEKKSRRDIDREIMFNKIMPTHLLDPESTEEDIRTETVQKVIVKPAPEETPPPAPETPPEPAAPAEKPAAPKRKSAPRKKAASSKQAAGKKAEPAPEPMPAPEPEPVPQPAPEPPPPPEPPADLPRYRNLTEYLVLYRLDGMIEKFKCCKCEDCRRAIVLYALNTLPPRYSYATKAEIREQIANADSASVLTCLIQAIMQVRANPPHTK